MGDEVDQTEAILLAARREDYACVKSILIEYKNRNKAAQRKSSSCEDPCQLAADPCQNKEPLKIDFCNDDCGNAGTLLHYAALWGWTDVVCYLIESEGMQVNLRNKKSGKTPFMLAVENRQILAALLLLMLGADSLAKNDNGYTALHYAIMGDEEDTVRFTHWAMKRSVKYEPCALNSKRASGGATGEFSNPGRIKGGAVRVPSLTSKSQLMAVTKSHHNLLKDEAQFRAPGGVETGHISKLRVARDSNAAGCCGAEASPSNVICPVSPLDLCDPLDTENDVNVTPLMVAVAYGRVNTAKALLKLGSSVKRCDSDGNTPLIIVAQNGDVEQCKVNWLNRENYSSNDHEIVSLLLDAGSDPNSANFKGRSALHYAVINGRLDIVQLLLRAGARLVDPDVNGDTPRDLAAKSDNDSVRSFMCMSVSKIIRCVAQLPAFPRPPEGDCAPPPCPTEEPSAPCPAPLPDPCPLKEPEDPCPPKEPPADPCPRQDDSHGYHRQQHSSRRSSEQTRHASAIRAPHGYRESRRDSVYVNTNTEANQAGDGSAVSRSRALSDCQPEQNCSGETSMSLPEVLPGICQPGGGCITIAPVKAPPVNCYPACGGCMDNRCASLVRSCTDLKPRKLRCPKGMLLKQCPSPDDCQKESSCESSAKKPCSKERKKKTKSRSSSKGKKEGCLGKCCLFGGGGKHGGFGKSVCCCDEDKKKGKKKKNKKDKCCSGMKKSDQMVCCSSSDTSRSSSRC